jgi:ubiquinone/menaquinone biosynthesis C-methylase UbiE
MNLYTKDTRTGLQAKEYAQWIAFAPVVFQATRVLKNLKILEIIQNSRKNGVTLEEISKQANITHYGARVLVEAGLGIGLILNNEDRYTLTKTGYFINSDELTKVNMNFVNDVCYEGMFTLEGSIKTGIPEGLKTFGSWSTLYEALAHLPAQVQKSWFEFDHFYSDDSFPQVLPVIFKSKPKTLLDIGGNTGKWTLACLNYDTGVHITIMDLPGQAAMATKNIDNAGFTDRVSFYPTDILDEQRPFPKGFDVIWMSQFLDCFSDEQIVSILKRCFSALNDNGIVYIMELFWDKQRFEAAAFSLQMTSLYFTNIANGNSQMYRSTDFYKLIEEAGFTIEEEKNEVGISHTLLMCKKKTSPKSSPKERT